MRGKIICEVDKYGNYSGTMKGDIASLFTCVHGILWQLILKCKEGCEQELVCDIHDIVHAAYIQALEDKEEGSQGE